MAYKKRQNCITNLSNVLCVFLIAPAISEGLEAPIYRENEFISHIPESPHLVMFFAPWCSHCQRLVPLWNRLAKHFSKQSSPVTVAKVDCTLDTPLCAQEDIKAYPTMRLFHHGEKATYRGQRDIADIAKFTLKELSNFDGASFSRGELAMELDTYRFEKEIQQGLKIVNFYVPWCSHCKRLAPTWQKLAEKFQYVQGVKILKFNCEKEKLICKKYKITGFPKILAFYQGSEARAYQGDRSFEDLKHFVEGIYQDYLIGTEEVKGDATLHDDLSKATEALNDGVPLVDAPDTTDDEVISLRKDLFNLAVSNGKTFTYFYAPWCKFCKQFSPIWKELAKKVIDKGIMVKIAKVDCTIEEELCQELKISSYPTIRLFHSRTHFLEYKGQRTVEALLTFIRQHERDEL